MSREEIRKQQRGLKEATRELDKDKRALERQEKQLEAEIKKAAKQGNKQLVTAYAKQLIKVRNQKVKSMGLSAQVTATGHQIQTMHTQAKMAGAMGSTAKTMAAVNKQVKVEDVARTMQTFERESAKMDMTGEMMEDTLDSLLTGSDDEAEEDAVVSKVLDEIGIEVNSKLSGVGVAGHKLGGADKTKDTDDIEERLKQLHS
ncbi:hypothetical protein EMCRGX_G034389 [Ephydatia muelleri]|eukprot:Em0023g323a